MMVKGTYLQNDQERPLVYGDVKITNVKRKRLRGEEEKEGILCEPVVVGFCGTDYELLHMGGENRLSSKFPPGEKRLVNGHEGIVWVPSQKRFAVVLIRGGDSYDPTRYTEDESFFEYGCDKADGLFCDKQFFHPDMLLPIPDGYVANGKLKLDFAQKMVFSDPLACMLFQLERMEDLGSAHIFRVIMARNRCSEEEARKQAKEDVFERTVIFGLGATGTLMGDLIQRKYKKAKVLFVSRSDEASHKVRFALQQTGAMYLRNDFETENELARNIVEKLEGRASAFIGVSGSDVEHKIAFENKVLGCNGIYNSFSLGPRIAFDTMPFGFENHLVFGSINFRREHMEKAIKILAESHYDEIVEWINRDELISDPIGCYRNQIFGKMAPMKTAVIWNEKYVESK